MAAFMSVKTGIAAALFGIIAIAAPVSTDAKPRTCTNSEIRTIVSDYLVIACINRGGSIKCDDGVGLCCKNDVCVDASNINLLSNDPGPPRPPRGVRTDPGPSRVSPPPYSPRPPRADPGPGRVGPSQNPSLPPRAGSPPSHMGSPASTGPRVK